MVENPIIIQGGMAVGVSNFELARAVALAGQELNQPVLGVVSGTGVEALLIRRLQDGDPDGHMQRALAAFPISRITEEILKEYSGSIEKSRYHRYKLTPKPYDVFSTNEDKRRKAIGLTIVANFAEVWLAKEGHDRPVGINHLEKIQMLHPYRLYGAMLAGVDYVLEGAGIPIQVPGVLDNLAQNKLASYRVDILGSKDKLEATFDPWEIVPEVAAGELKRPKFLAVISSNLLAKLLTGRRVSGFVDGFIIEGPKAGGHNAAPRRRHEGDFVGEPVYGEEDLVDLDEIASLGRPYWLAGSYASPARLEEAFNLGAAGIQAGTVFALSEESGMSQKYKDRIRRQAYKGEVAIITSLLASPTGYPFKVVQMEGTLSDPRVYDQRSRICDNSHLAQAYQKESGKIGFRCPAEPIKSYLRKAGTIIEDLSLEDRSRLERSCCLCNGLLATVGLGQVSRRGEEPPIITLGDNTAFMRELIKEENGSYSAYDALRYLLSAR